MEDAEAQIVIAAISRGDEQAMKRFYDAFSRSVYAFTLRRCGDQSLSEEVVVDTMYDIWKSARQFAARSQVRTWVLGIARHKMLDKLRAHKRDLHEELDETIASDNPGAFELLTQRQRAEGIDRCLDKLPDEQRECMHLVFYEGLGLAEVATMQLCPENTVKTRLFHAKRKIRQCLERLLKLEAPDD